MYTATQLYYPPSCYNYPVLVRIPQSQSCSRLEERAVLELVLMLGLSGCFE
jgi:hypothetical protein